MGAGNAIRAGAAYIEAFLDDNKLTRGLAAATSKLRGWSAGMARLGQSTRGGSLPEPLAAIANFSFSPAGLVTDMLAASRSFAHSGTEIAHLAEKAGTSAEVISALAYAAKRCGVDSDGLAVGLKKMSVNIVAAARGGKEANESFAMIGASITELAAMSPDAQFRYLAERIKQIQNPTERAAAAVKMFGRSGSELLPLLNQGAEGIGRFEKRAKELGLVTSGEMAEGALRFNRVMEDLHDVIRKSVVVIGSALAPYLEDLTNRLITVAVETRKWIADHKGLILSVFKVAGAIVLAGAGFTIFGRILGMLAGGIGGIVGGIRMVGTLVSMGGSLIAAAWTGIASVIGMVGPILAALFSPIGLVMAAVVGLGAVFLYYSGVAGKAMNWLKDVCTGLAADATSAFGAIADALAAGDIALAAKVVWALLRLEWQKGVNWITGIWVEVKDTFMSTWTEAVYGVARIMSSAWGTIQKGWSFFVSRLSAAWTIFADGVVSAWSAAMNWVKSTWINLKEAVGAIDGKEAQKARDKLRVEYETASSQRAKARDGDLAKIDKDLTARQSEINTQMQGEYGELEKARNAEHVARQKAYAKQVADAQAEVDKVKKEFASLRKQASDEAKAARPGEQGYQTGKGNGNGIDLAAEAGKGGVVRTFSAAAVSGLGTGTVFHEMKGHLAKIAGNGDKLLAAVENGGQWQ